MCNKCRIINILSHIIIFIILYYDFINSATTLQYKRLLICVGLLITIAMNVHCTRSIKACAHLISNSQSKHINRETDLRYLYINNIIKASIQVTLVSAITVQESVQHNELINEDNFIQN